MSNWKTVPNPAWEGIEPQRFTQSECHDRSHFVTIECTCGYQGHLHESSISTLPDSPRVGTHCKGCGDVMIFEPGELSGMFAAMREQGWIA